MKTKVGEIIEVTELNNKVEVFQGLLSYRLLERSLEGGVKMGDPGNEVVKRFANDVLKTNIKATASAYHK